MPLEAPPDTRPVGAFCVSTRRLGMAAPRGTIVTGRRAPREWRGKALQVEGLSGLIANIHATNERVGRFVRAVNRRSARQTRDLAEQFAPKDSGNLGESLTFELSKGEMTFTVYHDPTYFPDEPYHVFQELGFRHWISGELIQNPHLVPAFEVMRPHYLADISAAVRFAIRQQRAR